jgi:hypothetical protein
MVRRTRQGFQDRLEEILPAGVALDSHLFHRRQERQSSRRTRNMGGACVEMRDC